MDRHEPPLTRRFVVYYCSAVSITKGQRKIYVVGDGGEQSEDSLPVVSAAGGIRSPAGVTIAVR